VSAYEDDDGIDGPFERAMDRAIADEEAEAAYAAARAAAKRLSGIIAYWDRTMARGHYPRSVAADVDEARQALQVIAALAPIKETP
jgi:hypothetical protein